MVRQYAESREYLMELVQSAKSDMEKMTKERKGNKFIITIPFEE